MNAGAKAAVGTKRDTSRDGLRNRIESYVLSHWRPFWELINRSERLGSVVNKLIINNAVKKTRNRPHPLSTLAPYTSWSSLTDLTWFSRHLPPKRQDGLPDIERVKNMFRFDADRSPVSTKSTLLFPSFAQWFTDGFLLTLEGDRKRTKTNHAIDLSPLYGLSGRETDCIRTRSQHPGKKGRLKSEVIGGEEYAPTMFDEAGNKKAEFDPLPMPLALPAGHSLAKKRTIFAFAGERLRTYDRHHACSTCARCCTPCATASGRRTRAISARNQLALLIRGVFYQGWDPTGKPTKERHEAEFAAHVSRELARAARRRSRTASAPCSGYSPTCFL